VTSLDRRKLLTSAAACALVSVIPIDGDLSANVSKSFRLTPRPGRVPILPAPHPETEIWGYSGQVPGPEIRVRQGDRVEVQVVNGLRQPTTVHWHGLRIVNAMDGVPELTQPPILPGESFTYAFTVPDAGTYWYHPHTLSSQQIGHGLYGPLIVEEAVPPTVDRDVLWVMDDGRLAESAVISPTFSHPHDLSHAGRLGNVATLNGLDSGEFSVRAGERIRLRLINTANARIFGLGFEGHRPLVIARDGQPVEAHNPVGSIVLGPGQRADLILDMEGDPGKTYPVIDSYYQRQAYKYLDLVYSRENPLRNSPPDATPALAPNPLPEPILESARRHSITINGGAMGSLRSASYRGEEVTIRELAQQGKMWALNGVVAHGMAMKPLLNLELGRSHVLLFRNETAWPHPMHLHGHAFRILTRNGRPEPYRPWADTVLLEPDETAEVALVADNPGDWLLHCHILEHHEAGMACVVRVA
jgi:FtsP/CotA-like multicopper oxidase with cupredoxin domain